ncbi:Aste57867_16551 [Aphanomyces stellatus]|uniref:Aste57867_16551 protein n=1 Tax=Aphanomyces stellatus TaxID=120398 RepID=A0A485L5Q4_9STRA|nr:hypothetical protein As57867_016494 [Aphanomyces stellatus]VFT93325.1 Aste57867_16551 [Aphanomyces stellatus]
MAQPVAFSPFVGASMSNSSKPTPPPAPVVTPHDRRAATTVSAPELKWLRQVGHRATDALLRHDSNKQNVHVLPMEADGVALCHWADTTLFSIKGTITIFTDLAEVMHVLSTKHPALVQQIFARFFGGAHTTACVHYQPDEDNQHEDRVLSVETLDVHLATPSLKMDRAMERRQYTFLRFSECIDSATSTGTPGGVCVWESVDLKQGPGAGTARFRTCGFLVNATGHPHQVQLSLLLTHPLDARHVHAASGGAIPSTDYFILQRMVRATLLGFDGAIVDRRVFTNTTLPKHVWTDGARCTLCYKAFSLFRYKHHCRLCGDVVCAHCSVVRSSHAGSSVRACAACLDGATSSLQRASHHASSSSEASSETPRRRRQTTIILPDPIPSPYAFQPSYDTFDDTFSDDDDDDDHVLHSLRQQPYMSSTEGDAAPRLTSSSSTGSTSPHLGHRPTSMEAEAWNDQIDRLIDPKLGWGSMNLQADARSSKLPPPPPKNDDQFVTESTPLSYVLSFKDGNAWPDPPVTPDEVHRLDTAKALDLLRPHPEVHAYVKMACRTLQCPVGALTIVGGSKGLLIAKVAVHADSIARHIMLESHVLMSRDPLVVLDCLDDLRFMTNPLVCEGDVGIRFYVGVPLVASDGCILGALSVVDTRPRTAVRRRDLRTLVLTAQTLMRRFEDMSSVRHEPGQRSSEEQRERWRRPQSSTTSSDLDID